MREPEPPYYTSLGPFQELFRQGLPIITWHKVGRRPFGARLKGLYLSPRLFARQLAELRQAGFSSVSLNEAVPPKGNAGPRVGLTFDDAYENVLIHALTPLRQYRFQAIQFLVADRLGAFNDWDVRAGEIEERLMDASQVREWLAAGHQIGSHTLTHPRLTQLSPRAAREEISASKKKLEDLFGVAIEHFCYPYGDWNPAMRDLVGEAGYRTACTTEFGVNTTGNSPLELKRITARYQTRNWKTVKARLARFLS